MSVSIWWIRRDLRVFDNQPLHAALANTDLVIPLFILDPVLIDSAKVGAKRAAFLTKGLQHLDDDLRKLGGKLVVRKGSPEEVFSRLLDAFDVSGIYAEEDFSPYARQRDSRISAKYPLNLVGYPTARHPTEVLKKDGNPYKVYTPFMKAWKRIPIERMGQPLPAPKSLVDFADIQSDPYLELSGAENRLFPSGESSARERLERYVSGNNAPIYTYDSYRDRADLDRTSGLSPYLKFGMISARQSILSAYRALEFASGQKQSNSVTTWINQIIWRDFFYSILFHYPHVTKGSFRKKYDAIAWINDPETIQKWKEGQTGYPIVDAAMRQLDETGWMHNRSRMIAGSFLVKNLMVDWRIGEAWFMQNLIDADLASNNGGWQWVAGTGTDAAPYFRIFNPVTQSKKSDPDGKYIRTWVPALNDLPDDFIHTPWVMSPEQQKQYGCRLGEDYPEPIIDLTFSRQRALDIYKRSL